LLYFRLLALNRQERLHLIVAELLPPGVTWLLFGIGGVIAIMRVNGLWFYTVYDDTSVLVMSCYATVGIIAYLIAFRLMYRLGRRRVGMEVPLTHAYLITSMILLFDWYVRYRLIRSGMYFNYVAKKTTDITIRGTDIYYQVFHTISVVSLPLLLYLAYVRNGKAGGWVFKILIGIQLILIAAEASRLDLLYAGLALGLAFLVMSGRRISLAIIGAALVAGYLFLFIIGPLIQVARVQMRADALILIEEPAAIPVRFLTVYIPAIVNQAVNSSAVAPGETEAPQSVVGRLGSYMSYAASMYQSYINGTSLLPLDQLRDSVLQVVPRSLFPGKIALDQDAVSNVHFNVAPASLDSHGTYITDAFFHLHIVGVLALMLLAGVVIAFSARHLESNYGRMGQLLLIGLLPNFSIAGDSFGNYLAAMRNILLLLVVIKMVLWGSQVALAIAKRPSPYSSIGRTSESN
jgi:hypothetical protein